MLMPAPENKTTQPHTGHVVLDLAVNNHPGVMSHICGLFARRAFNLEGIACLPVGDGKTSRIWLLVNADQRLDQIIKQVAKLEDVRSVAQLPKHGEVFERLGSIFSEEPGLAA